MAKLTLEDKTGQTSHSMVKIYANVGCTASRDCKIWAVVSGKPAALLPKALPFDPVDRFIRLVAIIATAQRRWLPTMQAVDLHPSALPAVVHLAFAAPSLGRRPQQWRRLLVAIIFLPPLEGRSLAPTRFVAVGLQTATQSRLRRERTSESYSVSVSEQVRAQAHKRQRQNTERQ